MMYLTITLSFNIRNLVGFLYKAFICVVTPEKPGFSGVLHWILASSDGPNKIGNGLLFIYHKVLVGDKPNERIKSGFATSAL